jgi:outer membrane cobalamin receptor
MVRTVARRSCLWPVLALLFLCSSLLSPAASAQTRGTLSVPGIVVDEIGAAVAGARVTVSDDAGAVIQTTTSDAAGTFLLHDLGPGTYSVLVEMTLFAPVTQRVMVSSSGSATPIRAVLKAGGFAESIIVTARRVETRMAETPQKVEIIDATDIERSVAADLTDVLKKNAGVDVVQYSGALSGIGIRGFRPQTSGINKRSLLLIDGRPSGVTNLATLLLDNVERIEVLKGAASAVYGSSAMGGVVNVITRQSHGKIGGSARIGGGSFGTSEFGGRIGGSVSPRVDVDATGAAFDQRDDYRMGNGDIRPATRYKTYDGTVRLGVDLSGAWRVDGRADG